IKPANLLLAEDETIKLSDFGIAKMFGHSQQTAIGSVIGTVEYMAPEQADARPVDARSDLYSLGGVLYALLAGRAPLVADSLPEMLRKQRHEPPEPLDRLVSGVPAAVVKLIHQLLEKDPNRRIANARSLARQLDALGFVLAGGPGDGDGRLADEEGETQDEFVVNSEAASAGVVDPLGMMPTRAMEDEDDGDSLSEAAPEEVSPATMATDAFELAPSEPTTDVAGEKERDVAAATSSSEGTKSATRFTPVGEEELDPTPPPEEQEHPLISIQTWVLVACLLAVGATLYYFYLPPSPDALYERIMAKTTGETIDHAARDDIEQFLQRYSDDPRCRRLRGLQRQLTLDRLERQFDRQVKRLEDTSDLLPIQRAYLEARNSLRIDPERGMAKLKALIDLYSHEADTSGPTGECLELARRRFERLREESDRINKEMTELVDSRLEMADTLCATRPEEAKEMYEAVIELYSTKPWAGPAVRRARESLQAMDEQPQEMNSP
ncbi:MAG: protein kinase, partial [Pirellulaceae bacterium]|nr:protein kinase [Pirellulaceae bacterium]